MYVSLNNFSAKYDPADEIRTSEILNKNKQFHDQGLYSNTIFGRDDAFEYSCLCGETHGAIAKNEECHVCGFPVTKKQMVDKLGWITLPHGLHIIDPYFYGHVERILNLKNLSISVDINGNIVIPDNPQSLDGRGYKYLVDNLIEILETWTFKADKQETVKFLLKNKDNLFIKHIPVISKILRPAVLDGDEIKYDELNNYYMRIINTRNSIEKMDSAEINNLTISPLLNVIQQAVNLVDLNLMKATAGKYGWLRNKFMANRLDMSSRCVIIPQETAGQDIDEIELPYFACVELFKLQIIAIIRQRDNSTYTQAEQKWFKGLTRYSPILAKLIQEEIIDKASFTTEEGFVRKGVHLLINRNPTINKGSMLLMRLTKVKTDPSDLTMSISNNILKLLAGDYDGDVLNIFCLFTNEDIRFFEFASPSSLLISNNDGRFSHFFALDKDHVLGLTSMCGVNNTTIH